MPPEPEEKRVFDVSHPKELMLALLNMETSLYQSCDRNKTELMIADGEKYENHVA